MITVRNQLCLVGTQSKFYMLHFYRVTLDYLADYPLNVLEAAKNRVLVSTYVCMVDFWREFPCLRGV